MPDINIEAILNGTPVKRINNAHNRLIQEGLTESSAKEFFNVYSNEPLSAILECSHKIFSEPYYGASFYIEKVCTPKSCLFLSNKTGNNGYEKELEKVTSFIERVKEKLPINQLTIYEGIEDTLKYLVENTKGTRVLATYIQNLHDYDFNEAITEAVYNKNSDYIKTLFDESTICESMTYLPFIAGSFDAETNSEIFNKAKSFLLTESVDESNWGDHVKMVATANKLFTDRVYCEAMKNVPLEFKNMLNVYSEMSLNDDLRQMNTAKLMYEDLNINDPQTSVNNIFFVMQEAALFAEDYNEKKDNIRKINKIAYKFTNDLIYEESILNDSDDPVAGYTLFPQVMSISNLLIESGNRCLEYMSESDTDDDDEESIDDVIANSSEEAPTERLGGGTSGKKIKAPEATNLSTKIQNKAMDKEVQFNKKKSVFMQKGQQIKNAFAATTKFPRQLSADLKEMLRKLDEKDDERRKSYMTEPGFRKKAFKNLKTAIMYGGSAYIKLSLVPVVAICRHFSKVKNVRMRNELARELETEIKICEEKIQDANQNEDKREKYRLMRIQGRLKAEHTRVLTNSKYI